MENTTISEATTIEPQQFTAACPKCGKTFSRDTQTGADHAVRAHNAVSHNASGMHPATFAARARRKRISRQETKPAVTQASPIKTLAIATIKLDYCPGCGNALLPCTLACQLTGNSLKFCPGCGMNLEVIANKINEQQH